MDRWKPEHNRAPEWPVRSPRGRSGNSSLAAEPGNGRPPEPASARRSTVHRAEAARPHPATASNAVEFVSYLELECVSDEWNGPLKMASFGDPNATCVEDADKEDAEGDHNAKGF